MALSDRNGDGRAGDRERDVRLDRSYREAGDIAPPAHLDAAILAAARREVGARPRPLDAGLRRWHIPVSIAAVIVLSVSLVTLVREEGGDTLVQAPPGAPLPKRQGDAAPPPASTPAQPEAARPEVRPAAPATRPAASRYDGTPSAEIGKSAGRERLGDVATASSGTGSAVTAEPATKPAPEPFLAMPRDAGEHRAASPAMPALEDSAPPPAAARRSAQPASGPASGPERARVMAQAAESASARSDRFPIWHSFENEPPQKWLERIEELKRLERAADAADMLAEFRRRFPGHPLPPGLR